MLLASNQMALIEAVWLRVVVVAALCSLATGFANLNEYYLITFLLRYGKLGRVRENKLYRWAARWFSTSPLLIVALFAFLPLPVDVVRWLAILYRYSRVRYFVAYVLGRFPRYVVWALSAVWLDLNWWQIVVLQAVLIVGAGAFVVRSAWRRRHTGRTEPAELAEAGRMP
jgi:membrane protein YqaA with SNARE-associated domain